MSWTNERVDTLKKLWNDGHSASAIAATLGEVTRNGVIGKVHRLGLAGRASGSSRPRSPRATSLFPHRPRARRIRKPPSSPLPAAHRLRSLPLTKPMPRELGPSPETTVTVETLTERSCRWPEGDPKRAGFHFCGRIKDEMQGPYCNHHAAIAYR